MRHCDSIFCRECDASRVGAEDVPWYTAKWFGPGYVGCSGLRHAWGNSFKCPNNDDAHAHIHLSLQLEGDDHICDELHMICTLRRFALGEYMSNASLMSSKVA